MQLKMTVLLPFKNFRSSISSLTTRLLFLTSVGLSAATSSVFVNTVAGDVDLIESIATPLMAGSTPGSEVFVAAIASDTTLTADNTYLLSDTLFVTNAATLTIEAGTKIYGASFENGEGTSDNVLGSIVVTRGAQIEVLGTLAQPVLMTTIDALEAERGTDIDGDSVVADVPTKDTLGRWGGLVILGNAFVANFTDSDSDPESGNEINLLEGSIEGFGGIGFDDADGDGFSDLLEYGNSANSNADILATNNVESSGIIQFLSIRHGGFALADGNEINGLTMGGVGSGTVLDHIEVVANTDDAFEWFGGTVNSSHLVASFTNDDSFDLDLGHSGTHQFWFVIYDSTGGNHAGEWDGTIVNAESTPGGTTTGNGLANSNPFIFNATFLDAGSSPDTAAITFSDFFAGLLFDSAIGDFGFNETYENEPDGIGDGLTVSNNVFEGGNNIAPAFDLGNTYSTSLGLVSVSSLPNGLLDPRPAPGSPLIGTSIDTSGFPSVENVSYRGAFDPDGELFIAGWTFLQEAGFLPQPEAVEMIEIVDCALEGSNFRIDFESESNTDYRITFATDLSGDFTSVVPGETAIAGTGGEVSRSFSLPSSEEQVFFRVEVE